MDVLRLKVRLPLPIRSHGLHVCAWVSVCITYISTFSAGASDTSSEGAERSSSHPDSPSPDLIFLWHFSPQDLALPRLPHLNLWSPQYYHACILRMLVWTGGDYRPQHTGSAQQSDYLSYGHAKVIKKPPQLMKLPAFNIGSTAPDAGAPRHTQYICMHDTPKRKKHWFDSTEFLGELGE